MPKNYVRIVRVLMCLAVPASAVFTPLYSPAFAQESVNAKATRLAMIIAPKEDMFESVRVQTPEMVKAMVVGNPEMAELNKKYPGLDKVMVDVLLPIALSEVESWYPRYIADVVTLFVGRFDSAELDELIAFWASPPGQSLLRLMQKNNKMASVTSEMVGQINSGDFDGNTSKKAVDRDLARASSQSYDELSEDHRVAIDKFSISPVGMKLIKIIPEKVDIETKWANMEYSDEANKRLGVEIPKAIEKHITKFEK